MQTLTKTKWLRASVAATFLLPIALVAGCGGGGGGTSTPPTTFVGTYQGTYTFPAQTSNPDNETGLNGSFTLRVQTNGQATGVFNEENPTSTVSTSGTVNLSTGAIALSAVGVNNNTTTSNITVTGTATSTTSSGQVVVSDNGSQTGTFTAPKTSSTILPTATPIPTTSSALKRLAGRKVGGGN